MADQQVQRVSIGLWLLTLAAGVSLAVVATTDPATIVFWAAVLATAQTLSVPAPSGARIHLGFGVATVVVLLVPDLVAVAAIYAAGMSTSWLVSLAVRRGRDESAVFVSDTVSLGVFVGVFYGIARAFGGLEAMTELATLALLSLAAVAWFIMRAALQALVGFDRPDLSARYLWLLALEDWAVAMSIFVAGALFGFAWPALGWWALPIAVMPYLFSHLAFVRYDDTKRTYGQTIRALAQIPEVGGLAPPGHAERTAELSLAVARELGMHPDEVVELEYAALVHDIGRITLNEPAILRAGYTDEDIARWGAQIVDEAPYLHRVADYVRQQHRPYRQAGQVKDPTVPVPSKVIKVVSAYDQARHEMELPAVDALELVHRGSAYDYDPDVTASLRRVLTHRGELESWGGPASQTSR
jgi:hypothetical protein